MLNPNVFVSLRFRKQRNAAVSANDKKMPNGILEEQGTETPGGRAGATALSVAPTAFSFAPLCSASAGNTLAFITLGFHCFKTYLVFSLV